jgi:hypothetical protein
MARSEHALWIGSAVLGLYAALPLRACGNGASPAHETPMPSRAPEVDEAPSPSVAAPRSASSRPDLLQRASASAPTPQQPPLPAAEWNVTLSNGGEQERVRAQLRVDLERRLSSEHFDARRSADLRDYLDGAASDLGTTATVRDVACHETLCRVELHLGDPDDGRQLYEFAADQEQQREIFFEGAEGGGLSVVSYLFRSQRHADDAE